MKRGKKVFFIISQNMGNIDKQPYIRYTIINFGGSKMSDLTASNCGCDNQCGNNGGSWIWILILLCCCGGNGGGCGGFGGGCGGSCGGNGGCDSIIWILILLCCCGGNGGFC